MSKSPATTTVNKAQPPATPESKPLTIRDHIEGAEFKHAVADLLPKHLTADKFARALITATTRNPKLLECTKASFFKAAMDLSAMGLVPDGREAHLIPFRNWNKSLNAFVMECQMIPDYKGILKMIRQSGEISFIHADAVYEKDEFTLVYGSGGCLKHVPYLKGGDRGNILGYYSFVKLKDGSEDYTFMTLEEVDDVRKMSKTYDKKSGENLGPWRDHFNEMAKKTVIRRHSKMLPLSTELVQKINLDDDYPGTHDQRAEKAKPVTNFFERLPAPSDAETGAPEEASGEAEEPPTPAPEEPEKQAPADKASQDALTNLMLDAQISDQRLLKYCAEKSMVDGEKTVLALPADYVAQLIEHWDKVVSEIKGKK